MKELFRRFIEHDLVNLGAQTAYFLLLSIFPFLLFIVSLLAYLPFTITDVYLLLQNTYVPPGVLMVIEEEWNVVTENTQAGVLSIGAVFTLWTASLAVNSILESLNRAFQVTEARSLLLGRFVALLLTAGLFIIVIGALVLQVAGSHITDLLQMEAFLFDGHFLRWMLSSLMLFTVFLLVYWIGPSLRLRLRDILPGALAATIGWQVVSFLFSSVITRVADFSATYGTISTVIALMIWFHLISLIVLIGGEINAFLLERRVSRRPEKMPKKTW
ncbi:YihY/virulence factor BrkB family protein [Alkalicoccus urumqiensis]|uniref:Ribonuclease n=1 Tax=Alkalicoccus urumqiensis TaxID=1548213 RepID=A0A2P6MI68_ALKUR|nr:YihY/virulence factor BrkB family protein [Alkalicoccus urumqiensis]PRO65984.1 ribonuclease [Alkalicoccus urumqiensis]